LYRGGESPFDNSFFVSRLRRYTAQASMRPNCKEIADDPEEDKPSNVATETAAFPRITTVYSTALGNRAAGTDTGTRMPNAAAAEIVARV
jgi:hypothetical protein